MAAAKRKSREVTNDYPFYQALFEFYEQNKGLIKRNYRQITKKFLDYNDREKRADAYLRKPQFEALEIYVFVKEYLSNMQVKGMFADWYNKRNRFDKRLPFRVRKEGEAFVQGGLLDDLTKNVYEDVFKQLSNQQESYPNFIYALTMGLGKTILMATCIFYEFILAHKYKNDKLYCHNALVFAPDKTVLQSLKEIKTFDMKKVVPPEFVSFLASNVSFFFLDDNSTTLNTIDDSDYNIIISNTQKIILKTVHKEKTASEKFMEGTTIFDYLGVDKENLDDFTKSLYGDIDLLKGEKEVTMNQRFEKIIRLKQLGVYVDEAHHMFGTELKDSIQDRDNETSLRFTINKIAEVLASRSERVVGCFNYTGTPYVENKILPEVVYSFGLKSAIYDGYLKDIDFDGYDNIKSKEFLKIVLNEFFKTHKGKLYEGLLPKIAIYGSKIEEVIQEIKPAVEGILNDLGVDKNTILVNVGDTKWTKDLDIQNFNNLDVIGTEGSKKQVILLVAKGKEGWNCRSLFSVALYRNPKSDNFVLQSTMRCMRQITDEQQRAHIYLSKENYEVLDDELNKNFNISIEELKESKGDKQNYFVKIIPPVKMLKLEEIKKTYDLVEKDREYLFDINLDSIDLEKYKSKKITKHGISGSYGEVETEIVSEENRKYSPYSVVFEVARYLNRSPIEISEILNDSGKMNEICDLVSKYNGILYDEIIPAVFYYLYETKEKVDTITKEVPLIKYRKDMEYFTFRSKRELVVNVNDANVKQYSKKSFHVDSYCFDSAPEKRMFLMLLENDDVEEVYFTGMFTGSENGLSVQYIDPNSNIVRNYYPDLLIFYKSGKVEIAEVKGDNKIDDKEVEAKAYAAMELAEHSKMDYNLYKSSEIMGGVVDVSVAKEGK